MSKQILLIFLLILTFIWSLSVQSDTIQPLEIPIKTTDGRIFKLNDIAGNKPIYLKFWASWCQPCREQMPHLQHTYDQHGKNIEVLAVNLGVNDNLEAVTKTKQEFGLTVPITIDDNAKLSQAFNLIATPYHVLIDKKGNVVHTGHDASDDLDKKIELLVRNTAGNLPAIRISDDNSESHNIKIQDNKPTILFFASAWCDWYLEKSRPEMSTNCISAQQVVNKLHNKFTHLNWQGLLTRLWTGEKELKEYQQKYNVQYPLAVDNSNDMFVNYKVTNFPTLIAVAKGKEVFRLEDFSDEKSVIGVFEQLASKK